MSQTNTPTISAAGEAFVASMYQDVILENYKLRYAAFSPRAQDSLEFLLASDDHLKTTVGSLVESLCVSQSRALKRCQQARADVLSAPVSTYTQTLAAREFSNWLYAVDGDNWFPFEEALHAAKPYFSSSRIVLKMFRGFNPDGAIAGPDMVTTTDLPVVLNLDENTIALWTNELAD